MDFQVKEAFNSTQELARADSYTSKPIRLLHFQGHKAGTPTERPGQQSPWSNVSSSRVSTFSAVW
jgi:hypothetical protein